MYPTALLTTLLLTLLPRLARSLLTDGLKLRILPIGDSITFGWQWPAEKGYDQNGYRLRLQTNLNSTNPVVFAGVLSHGQMEDNYMAGYSGETIAQITSKVNSSLAHRPNIILLHAGTNDMYDTTEPKIRGKNRAHERLGRLVDHCVELCPDAVIWVAQIIGCPDEKRQASTRVYNSLIPGIVEERAKKGQKVLLADFQRIGPHLLGDGIHPSNQGYLEMGDMWANYVKNVPDGWVTAPIGDDPVRDPKDRQW